MTLIPEPLYPGDLVGVAAPAGYLEQHDRFHEGCAIIRDMGFEIVEPEKTWPGYGYLADRDDARLAELHRLWADPAVKAIFSLRGGFGCLRLLKKLDLSLIKKNPKLFVGFSDITILHNHFYNQTGLICMHGPGLATLTISDQVSQERLYHCLRGDWHRSMKEDIEIVRASSPVTGPLLGGNLSSLNTLLETSWFPSLAGSILMLEDVKEPLYRLDRLLTQLWLSGAVDSVSGIILGQFSDDDTEKIEQFRRNEFVWNRVLELTQKTAVPIWGNFPVGHCRRNLTVPFGAFCTMNCDEGQLHFLNDQYDY